MWRSFLSFVLVGLMLTACGGSGSSGGGGGGTTNPEFVGRWLGTWSSSGPLGNQQGSADLTIESSGHLAGTLDNQTNGAKGSLSGTIDTNGHISGTYDYPGYSATGSGSLTLESNGHLGGAVETYAQGKSTGTATFDLVKQ